MPNTKKGRMSEGLGSEGPEERWEDWGERFGKRVERAGIRMQSVSEGTSKVARSSEWWLGGMFDMLWPIFGGAIGIILLAIITLVLYLLNALLGSAFLSALISFLYQHMGAFFAIFTFGGYVSYLARKYPRTHTKIKPLTEGVKFAVLVWALAWIVRLVNTIPDAAPLSDASGFLFALAWPVFAIAVAIGYLALWLQSKKSPVHGAERRRGGRR